MSEITRVGADLAKRVIQVHAGPALVPQAWQYAGSKHHRNQRQAQCVELVSGRPIPRGAVQVQRRQDPAGQPGAEPGECDGGLCTTGDGANQPFVRLRQPAPAGDSGQLAISCGIRLIPFPAPAGVCGAPPFLRMYACRFAGNNVPREPTRGMHAVFQSGRCQP